MRSKPTTNTPPAEAQPAGPMHGFRFTADELSLLTTPAKCPEHLAKLGGVDAVCDGLDVDRSVGLSSHLTSMSPDSTVIAMPVVSADRKGDSLGPTMAHRSEAFGKNTLPAIPQKSLLRLMIQAFEDKILVLLSVAAVVSLSIGLYQDFRPKTSDDTGDALQKTHWIEGFAIIVAIVIVVLAGSINDYQKEKQFRKLNAQKEDRTVRTLRDGNISLISVYNIVVGDILLLESGDILPADGLVLSASSLKADESSATGETDSIKKSPTTDPFLLSGSKIVEGTGRCVITAVGEHSFHGKTMMAMRTENEETPLQVKLDKLTELIAKLGTAISILMFLVLIAKYIIATATTVGFGSLPNQESVTEVLSRVINIFIAAVTIIVVAVPEGLPLAVTLALAYATTRMLKDQNLVRVISACETMGGATTICSDKTGTLTQNVMTVVKGAIAQSIDFDDRQGTADASLAVLRSCLLPAEKNHMHQTLHDLVLEAVAVNSSVFERVNPESGKKEYIGSKTETALVNWIQKMGGNPADLRTQPHMETVQIYPFSSERKSMATLVKLRNSQGAAIYRLHVKGASEVVLGYCQNILVAHGSQVEFSGASPPERRNMGRIIQSFAKESLRTLCIAYRDLTEAELNGLIQGKGRLAVVKAMYEEGLTCLAIVGIEDPLRPGVKEAVEDCRRAGVVVRMVTGDNIVTAVSIAKQCGIYQPGGIVMEGPRFRSLAPAEMDLVIPRLQVLARSSPTDKQILVSRLKHLKETVAVTGDGTNDGPALKMADIGFSMGIAGTEVAKEASSIILMDDNFASIVKAMMWGRCVNDGVKKFLQFQLTVNVTAVVVAFVSALLDADQGSALSAVQLLWVNLIMDSLAALVYATDLPTRELLDRPPESKSHPLITIEMWKMILGQSVFQIIVNLLILLKGPDLFGFRELAAILTTILFNTFVWLQIFNMINCHRVDSHLNVFKTIFRNVYFVIVFVAVIVCQAIIVQFGGVAFKTLPLSGGQWAICIAIGLVSLPLGAVIRLVPDEIVHQCLGPTLRRKLAAPTHTDHHAVAHDDIDFEAIIGPQVTLHANDGKRDPREMWRNAISSVQTELKVFRVLRSARRLDRISTHSRSSFSSSIREAI
ncbi:PMCA-type calcium-translocating P-type ATPase [Polychytrium aggregatum]|uniref:PMCA-type calcium-translocating P-type ATPase n=1 Tax=Polychytrium aggregatum TaxID=110093 RepID=UPI0022FEF64D|nr:PMCA-type calcium-translocating P-type ATPase [Polychytrium aggregatum]KAI9204520.1 PMCA-type calcium-translocating P-type ATPase [Polychytrium aggregatum]